MNTVIDVQNRQELSQFTGDLEVVSVMPEEPVPAEWDWDTGHLYKYKVEHEKAKVMYSKAYSFVQYVHIAIYMRFSQIYSSAEFVLMKCSLSK